MVTSSSTDRADWPFQPNWQSRYVVSYQFQTAIFVSDDGSEQRRALRSTARKTLSFSILVHGAELSVFNRLLATGQNRLIVVPEVTRYAVLRSAVAPGDRLLRFSEPVPPWITAGNEVILADRFRAYHRATVDAVATDHIVLSAAPGRWESGSLIHPSLSTRLGENVSSRRATSRVAEATVEFSVDPGSEEENYGVAVAIFEGTEWLQLSHNWASGLSVDHVWPSGTMDFGRGRVVSFTTVEFSAERRTFDLTLRNAAPVVAFFGRMRGQRGRFLVSSQEEDMQPIGLPLPDRLSIRGAGVYESYRGDPNRSLIEIKTASGAMYARKIVAMTPVNGNTELTLAEGLPAVTVADIVRISWLSHARFASDLLEVSYAAPGAAQVQISVITRPAAEAVEDQFLRVTPEDAARVTPEGDQREVVFS